MSYVSAKLMKSKRSPRRNLRWEPVLVEISSRLADLYGCPDLGNVRDPVREIFYIALSAKTTERLYQKAFHNLWSRFDDVGQIAVAPRGVVASCVKCAGLGNKRASHVKRIAAKLVADFPSDPSAAILSLPLQQAFDYLTSLPGVGPKSAFCVMMMSLDMDVFPVDVNVQRLAERIGIIKPGLKHYEVQRDLPGLVPPGVSKQLHIGMVVHGRKICLPQRPRCNECVLQNICRYGQRILKKEDVN